jgi:hypothetical protein
MEAHVRIGTLFFGTALLTLVALPAAAQTTYTATLLGVNEVPTVATPANGSATVVLDASQTQLSVTCSFANLIGTYTASHIHGPAPVGVNAGVKWGFVAPTAPWVFSNGNHDGTLTNFIVTGITPTDVTNLNNGQFYVNVHSTSFPGGEIRGQLNPAVVPTQKNTWGRIKALYQH